MRGIFRLEKRLPIALLLSFLVLVGWQILNPPPPPAEVTSPVPVDGSTGVAPAEDQFDQSELVGERVSAEEEEEITQLIGEPGTPGCFEVRYTNRGARLLSLRIGDYFIDQTHDESSLDDSSSWVELLSTVDTGTGMTGSLTLVGSESARKLLSEPLEDALWSHSKRSDGGIEFQYEPGTGVRFIKRITPVPGKHELHLELGIENIAAPSLVGLRQFRFTPADIVPTAGDDAFYREPQTLIVWRTDDGALERDYKVAEGGGKDLSGSFPHPTGSRLSFAGVHNKFFALLATPADPASAAAVLGANYRRVRDLGWLTENPEEDSADAWRYVVCDLSLQLEVPEVGQTSSVAFVLYAGPKQSDLLEATNPDFEQLIEEDIGMFSSIAGAITAILAFYHGIVGNWGFAIILMTLTVRLLLFPLNRRAQTAMARFAKKMKRVQPLIDAIKEKHKSDPKKLREEQGRIMQEHGAFPPLGGCLPMFLQFPVFIGLFKALRVHFDLRQEPFILWMKDLSAPDQLAHINLDTHLPFIGTIEYLNILPLLMIVLWIAQHKVMPQPTTSDPNQERTRKMMIGMQVFFAFLFYNYASGLALYMITSSALAIFETVVIKKVWPIDDSELEKKKPKPGGLMHKLAEAKKKQMRLVEDEKRRRGQGKKGGGKKKR